MSPVWSEPPRLVKTFTARQPKEDHVRTAKELEERSGEWARVDQFDKVHSASRYAATIRNGRSAFGPVAGTFDAVARRQADGEAAYGVWARHLGEKGRWLPYLREMSKAELLFRCEHEELPISKGDTKDEMADALMERYWQQGIELP